MHVKEKIQSKLHQCCAMFLQPHVVYCRVCKAVDGLHFLRNLIRSELALQDRNSVMTDWHYRFDRFDKCTWCSEAFFSSSWVKSELTLVKLS